VEHVGAQWETQHDASTGTWLMLERAIELRGCAFVELDIVLVLQHTAVKAALCRTIVKET
jgi:hypothetical protein